MSKYLLTGNGRRLLTGDGAPLMADAPGSAWSEIEAAPASIKMSGSASPVAMIALSAAAGLIAITGTAQPSAVATADLAPSVISITGSASPHVESSASATIWLTGTAQIGADVWITPALATIQISGSASPTAVRTLEAEPAVIRVTGTAEGAANAPVELTAAPAVIRFTGTAEPSVNTGAKFRGYWLNAYAERQAVLNAIDANNRFLAKSAGDKADAAADAVIITNTRVDEVEGVITAESLRITDLTANVGTLDSRVTTLNQARVDDDDALAARIDQTDLNMAGKASTSALNAQISRIDTQAGQITANSNALTQVNTSLTGKASTGALNLLDAYVRSDVDGRVTANSAAITQVKAEVASGAFAAGQSWIFQASALGFTGSGATITPFPVSSNSGIEVNATGADPRITSPAMSVSGAANYIVRAMVRRRVAAPGWDGGLFWATPSHGISGSYRAQSTSVPPADNAFHLVEWNLSQVSDWRNNTITGIALDFEASAPSIVDVLWIGIGAFAPAASSQVTSIMRADIDAATGKINASHTVALDVNGYNSGFIAQNNGVTSSWRFRSDTFGVYSPSGAGLQWTNGTLWNSKGIYSMLAGPDLGEGMLFYIGKTPISPQTAAKADAIFYVDHDGTGYFAGKVLQGILRGFGSSTEVGNTNVIAQTQMLSSNGKAVALEAKFSRQFRQQYNGASSVITLGAGNTACAVYIQRQYEGQAWETIAVQEFFGSDTVFNEDGVPSFIVQTVGANLLATDPPDGRRRTYRILVGSVVFRAHSVTNPGTAAAPVNNQYQAIESME